MLIEKEVMIEKLRSELDRLKLNNRLANSIVESPTNYANINEVNAKRMLAGSVCGSSKSSKISESSEGVRAQVPLKCNQLNFPEVAPAESLQELQPSASGPGSCSSQQKEGKKVRKRVVLQLKDLFD